jgi:hypothetical protein
MIVGLLSWLSPIPRPTLVALSVSQYQNRQVPWPAQVGRDTQALQKSGIFGNVIQPGDGAPEQHMILRQLNELKDRGAGETVVLLLSAMAMQTPTGIEILASNSEPDQAGTRVRLETVLRGLADCPANHKLLVLDIMHPLAQAQLGIVSDDVAAGIEKELEKVPDERRLVLSSCSPGQVALASEAAGRSIFSLYLEEGLAGWADGYGARGSRDGRVTVTELAEFVKARVGRWAQQNRQTQQTPVLYGSADDFSLHAPDVSQPPGHVAMPAAPAYPAWLKDGWKKRDEALADGSWRLTPRLFRQEEAWLVKAESEWRGGGDVTYIQGILQQLKDQAAAKRIMPAPQPQSIALATALGDKEDTETTKSLLDFFAGLKNLKAADPARAKLIEDFRAKFAKAAPFARAAAVVQQLAAEPQPTRDKIELLDQLVDPDPTERPRFVETLMLKRLAEMTGRKDMKTWPTDLVKRLLQVTYRGEQATSQFAVASWNAPLLAQADQLRHDGEVLFWSPGFGLPEQADDLLARAASLYAKAKQRGDLVLRSQAVLDDALLMLPGYVPYLEKAPSGLSAWKTAVSMARELDDLLHASAGNGLRSVDGLATAADRLQAQLAILRQPYAGDNIGRLIRRSKEPRADPGVVVEIDAMLTTPLLRADDRVALWQAGLDLQRRLHQQTVRLDRDEDDLHHVTEPQAGTPQEQQTAAELAALRAEASVTLLDLGGLPKALLEPLESDLRSRNWSKLDVALTTAWARQLPNQVNAETLLPARDRLTRCASPFVPLLTVDDLPMSLPVEMRLAEAKLLWDRLGSRYRYLSRDYAGAGLDWSPLSSGERFFAQAALAYQPLPDAQAAVNLTIPGALPRLTLASLQGSVPLSLEWTARKEGNEPLAVSVLATDAAWLAVEPASATVPGKSLDAAFPLVRRGSLTLDARLVPGVDAERGPAPRGFLVQAALDGRHFHFKVPVSLQTSPTQPHVLISSSPKAPTDPLSEIRLRPGKVRQSFYLFAHNPTDSARKVTIEIKTGAADFKGSSFTTVLSPNSTQRFGLAGPDQGGALPAGDWPEFVGPLVIRVLDADQKNELFDEQQIPVEIARPRDYVRVTSILFTPTQGGKPNDLMVNLQVFAAPGGPDIPVDLVLPADRIPGLVAAKDGTFKGELSATGEKGRDMLTLAAQKIVLAPGEDEEGVVYLNVDGYERAFVFRTTFLRQGGPTTPRGDIRPAVRLRTDPFVRAMPKYPLTVETDNPPEGSTLEVTVGQRVAGEFQARVPAKIFPDAKRKRITWSPQSPDGGIVFETTVQDWTIPLDTSRLLGRQEILMRMLDRNGREVAKAVEGFIVEDSGPDGAHFVHAPKALQKGSKVVLRATGASTQEKDGIKDAVFFLGRPPADGKLPPTLATFKGRPARDKSVWEADVTLPDVKGPVDISVQLTNHAGLSSFATTSIDLWETDPAKTAAGKIKGQVVLGDLPQAGLPVSLRDAKGAAELAATKTKDDGSFVFEGVAPGNYTVYCRRNDTQRAGSASVTVEANKETEVTVNLRLRVTK